MSEPMSDRPPETDRPPVPDRPLVHGERVWLRPLEERDAAAYVAGMNDTEVGGWAGYREPMSVEQARGWFKSISDESQSHHGRGWFFAVCELGDDRFIGTTWLKDVNLSAGIGELAIFMDRDHIGSGWGTDAQRALLNFAFTNIGLQRVFLTVFVANERAIRSYEKLGFQREGVLRRSWRGIRGLEDSLIMGILKEEWEAQTPG